jgi:hypothetical protein
MQRNYTEELIAMIPDECWCAGKWSPEQKAGFFLALCLSADIEIEFMSEFVCLLSHNDRAGKKNGIYYPECINQDYIERALDDIKKNPSLLKEIGSNPKIIEKIWNERNKKV